MKRESLDNYDVLPKGMIDYLSNYGRHFNQHLLKFSLNNMKCKNANGELIKLAPLSKEDVDKLLNNNRIVLENNQLYDYVYVANMCKADFLGSSIVDEFHMALYIKDVIDDPDAYDGIVFNRWYADTRRNGISVDWDSMI